MRELTAIPRLRLVRAAGFSDAQHDAVDRVWQESLSVNSSLFDGPMTCVHRITDTHIEVFTTPYKYWHSQFQGKVDLGLRALAVSGLVRMADGLLICKRGDDVSQHSREWEFAPSGGVEIENENLPDDILLAQLLTETYEELNLTSSDLTSPRALAVVHDDESGVVDVVIKIECSLNSSEFENRWASRKSREYDEYAIVDRSDAEGRRLCESSSMVLAALDRYRPSWFA